MLGIPSVLAVGGDEGIGTAVVLVPVVCAQLPLDIAPTLADPSWVVPAPTPPALKSPGELDVPVIMGLPVPMPEHVVTAGPAFVAETGPGLMPGVGSSVAPMGTPVAPTGEPGPIPSGEVEPTAGVLVCA